MSGKSVFNEMVMEAALNMGKTVALISADSVTIKKRRKHLTSIEVKPVNEIQGRSFDICIVNEYVKNIK
jgi:D-aminopeptidase